MKKTFKLENLDCAHCASKIEDAIKKVDGVIGASVNFMYQKMVLEAPDDKFDTIFNEVKATVKKIESDIKLVG
ncbi:cation transporter [Selenomonadales bacterium OttesenSCG-928-I06]|nr:cation transporter [Selenomonadales bacterium OttesenSCG-928-I06]